MDIIREVKNAVAIPVIANGDIKSAEDAKHVFEYTGADAIMIGRAAIGNPWIFKEVLALKNNENTSLHVTNEEKLKVILEHIDLAVSREDEKTAIPKLRKYFPYYLKGINGATLAKQKLNTAKTKDEVVSIILELFESLENGTD